MSYYDGPDEDSIHRDIEDGVKKVKEIANDAHWQQIELEAHKGNKWAQQQWKEHLEEEARKEERWVLLGIIVIIGVIWLLLGQIANLEFYSGYDVVLPVWISRGLTLVIPIASSYIRFKKGMFTWTGVLWDTIVYVAGGYLFRQVIVERLAGSAGMVDLVICLVLVTGYTIFAVWALNYKLSVHQAGKHQPARYGWSKKQRFIWWGIWVVLLIAWIGFANY